MSEPVEVAHMPVPAFTRLWAKLMLVVGPAGNFVPLIQALEVWREQNSRSQSLAGWGLLLFCVASWLIYGIALRNAVLIVANIVGVINIIILMVLIVVYAPAS